MACKFSRVNQALQNALWYLIGVNSESLTLLSVKEEKNSKNNITENGVLFSNDTGKLGKINSECSYQESNLRASDY